MHGLNPFVKMQLRLANTQTFKLLLDAAITFEDGYKNVQEDHRKRAKKEMKRIQASKPKTNLEFQHRNRPNNNNRSSNNTGGQFNPRRNVISHNCKLPGHISKDCQKLVIFFLDVDKRVILSLIAQTNHPVVGPQRVEDKLV